MESTPLQFRKWCGCWGAYLETPVGRLQVMIPGLNEPSERAVSAVHAIQQRLPDLVTKLERIHKQLWWPRLYRPIRLMVDDEYRVLVHFRNRFDGSNHEFLVE